jgi:hypothetical protein
VQRRRFIPPLRPRTAAAVIAVGCVAAIGFVLLRGRSGADREAETAAFLGRVQRVFSKSAEPQTSEAKKAAFAKNLQDLDTDAQSLTLEFRFPISKVDRVTKGKNKGMRALKLSKPANVPAEASGLKWDYRHAIELEIPDEAATSIVPGDLLILSGRPHLLLSHHNAVPGQSSNAAIWILHAGSGESPVTLCLQAGWSHRIEHAKKSP